VHIVDAEAIVVCGIPAYDEEGDRECVERLQSISKKGYDVRTLEKGQTIAARQANRIQGGSNHEVSNR